MLVLNSNLIIFRIVINAFYGNTGSNRYSKKGINVTQTTFEFWGGGSGLRH